MYLSSILLNKTDICKASKLFKLSMLAFSVSAFSLIMMHTEPLAQLSSPLKKTDANLYLTRLKREHDLRSFNDPVGRLPVESNLLLMNPSACRSIPTTDGHQLPACFTKINFCRV